MDRGKRLSSRALTFALLCGSVFGVTGASGHGDNAVHPHFARPVAIRMSARAQVNDPTALAGDQSDSQGNGQGDQGNAQGDGTSTTGTTTATASTTPGTSTAPTSTTTTPTTTTPTTTTTTPSTTDTTTSSQGSGASDTSGSDNTGSDTSGSDTTGTGTTCPPAPGTPGFVPAGHATGDPWKSCTQIGPGGSGQAGGGTGQAGGGTTPPVTVPTTPVPPVTTTPSTPTLPSTTGTGPSSTGSNPGGSKPTTQSSNPFSTGGTWTQVAKAAKRGKSRSLFNNANGLLGIESGLGVNGTLVGLSSALSRGTAGVGLDAAGANGSGIAGAAGGRGSGQSASGHASGHVRATDGNHNSGPLVVFFKVVPKSIWLALAGAFGLAFMATGAAVFFGRRSRRQANRIAEVSAAALTDPLTGVLNRRGFTEAVERELARSRRYARPFVIAYVDVRGLKGVNDSEGHLAGDELLKAAARTLSSSARAHDVVGRLGGDEFGVLLAEQSVEDAQGVVARIRERVQATRTTLGFGAFWDLTIGTASFSEDGDSFEELIAAADRRLYEQRGIELSASR